MPSGRGTARSRSSGSTRSATSGWELCLIGCARQSRRRTPVASSSVPARGPCRPAASRGPSAPRAPAVESAWPMPAAVAPPHSSPRLRLFGVSRRQLRGTGNEHRRLPRPHPDKHRHLRPTSTSRPLLRQDPHFLVPQHINVLGDRPVLYHMLGHLERLGPEMRKRRLGRRRIRPHNRPHRVPRAPNLMRNLDRGHLEVHRAMQNLRLLLVRNRRPAPPPHHRPSTSASTASSGSPSSRKPSPRSPPPRKYAPPTPSTIASCIVPVLHQRSYTPAATSWTHASTRALNAIAASFGAILRLHLFRCQRKTHRTSTHGVLQHTRGYCSRGGVGPPGGSVPRAIWAVARGRRRGSGCAAVSRAWLMSFAQVLTAQQITHAT